VADTSGYSVRCRWRGAGLSEPRHQWSVPERVHAHADHHAPGQPVQYGQSVPPADPTTAQHSCVDAQPSDPNTFCRWQWWQWQAPGDRCHVPPGRQEAHGYCPEGSDTFSGCHRITAAAHGVGRRAGRPPDRIGHQAGR